MRQNPEVCVEVDHGHPGAVAQRDCVGSL
jgi:hypothetical protein